ncbi:hypothetical protein OG875_02325 [Streptomyces sp. NBC_01498]|uniref:hypothetical protein n=1 Tax=Streptomyces sp. NBC_01498 TaxID=2975870 RepID=UPI002E7B068E|nr:hypothetical protein [Streptomyces sp. NBC_01498]WTL23538.1 hypothetical protein OG875_02325 [Streptomyces sp. NBC_01498]
MTPDTAQHEHSPPESGHRRSGPQKLRNIEVWARSAPIRLAGYEDDLAEPHILQGVD